MEIPPRGTRGTGGVINLLGFLFRPMTASMVARYRRNAGDKVPIGMGFPQVVLTTIGTKTGVERSHILGGFDDGHGGWLVMASKGGAATHPAWYINMAKQPDKVWLEVGKRKFKARPELLRGAEREKGLALIVGVAPRYGVYEKKTDRQIPIVRLTPE